MPTVTDPEHKVDYRIYIGIIVFRWQIIAICMLYALLGGVIYLQLATRIYETRCLLLIHRDRTLDVSSRSFQPPGLSHIYLLKSDRLRSRVADQLFEDWGEVMGNKSRMKLPVNVLQARRLANTMDINVRCANRKFGAAFLSALVVEHQKEADSLQRTASSAAIRALEDELSRIEEKVNDAEKEVTHLQRIYDMVRETEEARSERMYLSMLVNRRRSLMTELSMMETQNPELKGANAAVLNAVRRHQVEVGEIEVDPADVVDGGSIIRPDGSMVRPTTSVQDLPPAFTVADDVSTDIRGWHELRVQLSRFKVKEKTLLESLKPTHPSVKELRKQIQDIEIRLQDAQKVAEHKLQDRHRALNVALRAVESAIYRWRAKSSAANEHRGELRRQEGVVKRYQSNYGTLYARLHDLKATEELKLDHFRLIESVRTLANAVWPDPLKILLVTLVLGLGSGFGLALTAHALDNKIQTIDDVERTLGVKFLGGIPFWVHSGLDEAVRPIVTEEHSTGAVEAYRALRTTVLAALERENEKIVILTSADSKEGKTLTTLNLAIMISQMGKRVLLVDMDLRRGRLHRSLGIEREPGMTNVLSDGLLLRDVIVQTRFDHLDAIASGASMENTSEKLQATDLVQVFDKVRDDYDYIVIDSSPVLRVTDAVIVATQGLGVVIYVARVNKTPKPLIRYSLDMLAEARVLGMIMNSIEMHRISSLYYAYQYPNYAYYSNAYSYGYDYYYYGDKPKGGPFRRYSAKKRRESLAKWMRRTFLPME